MSPEDPVKREWPGAETPRAAPPVRRGRLARLGRALGDILLTAGMSKGLTGDRSGSNRAASNARGQRLTGGRGLGIA